MHLCVLCHPREQRMALEPDCPNQAMTPEKISALENHHM